MLMSKEVDKPVKRRIDESKFVESEEKLWCDLMIGGSSSSLVIHHLLQHVSRLSHHSQSFVDISCADFALDDVRVVLSQNIRHGSQSIFVGFESNRVSGS